MELPTGVRVDFLWLGIGRSFSVPGVFSSDSQSFPSKRNEGTSFSASKSPPALKRRRDLLCALFPRAEFFRPVVVGCEGTTLREGLRPFLRTTPSDRLPGYEGFFCRYASRSFPLSGWYRGKVGDHWELWLLSISFFKKRSFFFE